MRGFGDAFAYLMRPIYIVHDVGHAEEGRSLIPSSLSRWFVDGFGSSCSLTFAFGEAVYVWSLSEPASAPMLTSTGRGRHMCSALLLLAGVSCCSCCVHSVLRAAATLCSVPHLLARASREEKEVDEGKPSHAWRG